MFGLIVSCVLIAGCDERRETVRRHDERPRREVIISGAIFGLLGTQFELLSLYLTRDGWMAFGTLDAITVALSALASVLWWVAARALQALVRRLVRGRATAAS